VDDAVDPLAPKQVRQRGCVPDVTEQAVIRSSAAAKGIDRRSNTTTSWPLSASARTAWDPM
jgi:hypothetical protein